MTRSRFPARERPLTVERFLDLPEDPGYRLELVRGRVVREPGPAPLHARVLTELVYALVTWAKEAGEGVVLTDAGFVLSEDPATVRVPDLAFVSDARIPDDPYAGALWRMAPDLAVEVLSPSNTAIEVQEKVLEYFAGGARLVWIVNPRLRTVTVHESAGEARLLMGDAVLGGGSVLPGLELGLRELFSV